MFTSSKCTPLVTGSSPPDLMVSSFQKEPRAPCNTQGKRNKPVTYLAPLGTMRATSLSPESVQRSGANGEPQELLSPHWGEGQGGPFHPHAWAPSLTWAWTRPA